MKTTATLILVLTGILLATCTGAPGCSELPPLTSDLDRQVWHFLEQQHWRDMNVPEADGKLLHDLILRQRYTSALEIGTSTGRSAIWMAWALSKTGGRLITIEIDPDRHQEAVANFEKAGLSEYVDARLADAHTLVHELEGPFDFVFCDADKDWYIQYLDAVLPKLAEGGCYTAHNVTSWHHGPAGFVDYLQSLSELETTINRSSAAGVSVSYKRGGEN